MLGALKRSGHAFVSRPEAADVIIVNTCGFIRPARAEAEKALKHAVGLKRRNPGKTIVAAGCYVERDRTSLQERFPGVDFWTGVRSFDKIAELLGGRPSPEPDRTFLYSDKTPRVLSTPATWAYVKVSEGCSHRCAFCAIPVIKGPYVSRSMASVVREAAGLAELGVREINLISHDTTYYGRDRGIRNGLVKLIDGLARVTGIEWVRILYGYPEEITDPLLEVMAHPKVCRYLDIPFQHGDPAVVKSMRRGMDAGRALRLLERIRTKLPGVAVRTSLIVGYPGEGRREFAALEGFVKEARFDHLGVFAYSPERDTAAFARPDQISQAEKNRRHADLMALQAGISSAKNKTYVGSIQDVIVERRSTAEAPRVIGRSRFQAPEVDGVIRVSLPGEAGGALPAIINVEITSASVYDLRGRLAS